MSQKPYWNMWRVIFVGLVIRNPKVLLVPLGFLLAVLYNLLTN